MVFKIAEGFLWTFMVFGYLYFIKELRELRKIEKLKALVVQREKVKALVENRE